MKLGNQVIPPRCNDRHERGKMVERGCAQGVGEEDGIRKKLSRDRVPSRVAHVE